MVLLIIERGGAIDWFLIGRTVWIGIVLVSLPLE